MRRSLLWLALLTFVYAAVLASFHPWDLLFGAALSGAVLYAFRGFVFERETGDEAEPSPGFLRRCVAFFPFAVATAWDVTLGTWEVALVTLHIRPLKKPGMVKVPVGERTPTGVAVTALVTTLSPGAFLVGADDEHMLMHLLDASDPDAFRREREEFYRRYQRKVFP